MDLKRYEARLRHLPCVVCVAVGRVPPNPCQELHHAGPVELRNDWLQIPLCWECHQGREGIHGQHRRTFFKEKRVSDFALLAMTIKLYHGEMP